MSISNERLEAIFEAALALETPAQRASYLGRACPDPEARRQLEARLASQVDCQPNLAKKTISVLPFDDDPPAPNRSEALGGYRLIRMLGRGGMGSVYEAEEMESGRSVALKVLSRSLQSATARQRFLREGLLAASINHPNTVYVFGTEEIDGQPVIVMELVRGGTLEERVNADSRMAIADAVEAILQVIAGLEAAAAQGVLHRDIKPSNCFVEIDGTVKVGDFGLAVSSDPGDVGKLTGTGSYLGTPAYSPPEQLRGDPFTLQGDIYAVGVTLYSLLTGRTPFPGDDLVRMLATVLERPADSPARWRPELPSGLCRVILRCLEKQPSKRYRSYAELRRALNPYNSVAPSPATLSLRALAGGIDFMLLLAPRILATVILEGGFEAVARAEVERDPRLALDAMSLALYLLYFGLLEGLWGASLGKRLCGLRVADPNCGVPGVSRAMLRAVITGLAPMLPTLVGDLIANPVGKNPVPDVAGLIAALLFCTARRRNGFAAIHDLVTRTRVIRQSAAEARPRLPLPDEPIPSAGAPPQFGPYHVIRSLATSVGAEILLGFDTRVLRKVWIRKLPPGAEPVAPSLRALNRIGRLRWLNGKRTEAENWDAYEGVSGECLSCLIRRQQSWTRVRYWLLDLAEELDAAAKDQSTPEVLGLERVWITADGHAKLLDFPAPNPCPPSELDPSPTATRPNDGVDPRRFLKHVAASALEGRVTPVTEATPSRVPVPLPPHARAVLAELEGGLTPNQFAERLRPLVTKLSTVNTRRRLGLVAGASVASLAVLVVGLAVTLTQSMWFGAPSNATLLSRCLIRWSELQLKRNQPVVPGSVIEQANRDSTALELYMAGRFSQDITNPATWTSPALRAILPDQQAEIRQRVMVRGSPSAWELHQAAEVVEPLLKAEGMDPEKMPAKLISIASASGWTLFYGGAIPSLAAALLFRGGMVLRLLGLAVVRHDGGPASRLRIFWRGLIAWSPTCILRVLTTRFGWDHVSGTMPWHSMAVTGLMVTPLVGLVVWAALLPGRGLHDRLAGTSLVPRE